ncbi:MAG TPA: hypothetical protein VH394_02690 [Thermoanaerobaculia bacterium]|jgi:hypothetical protein|nr:hypothetical protein [Thermoanaerobaculia bacterium]
MPRKRALALVACLAFAADGAAQRFEEKLAVREVELVFEPPSRAAPGPRDLTIIEDGLVRPVTKVGSLEDSTVRSPWTAVVWVDKTLASPGTVFASTLGLAKQAAGLAGLGSVEIVVADPAPEILAGSTREPKRVEQVLADVAGKARVERDRAEAAMAPRAGPDVETLRRQLDRLLVHLTGRRDAGPRVLFLVADGFNVTPEEMKAFETGKAGGGRTEAILETARLLAAYGWVTVALPIRQQDAGQEDRSVNEGDRFRYNHGDWGPTNNSVPPMIPPKAPKDTKLKWPAVIEAQIQPDLSPLRALIGPTAGMLATADALLPSTLATLGNRWHLYYQTQLPADGRLRPVEVRTRDGSPVRARQWARSSTPEAVAEARLRRLLAGDSLSSSLPLRVEAGTITVAPFSAPEPAVAGPVRISIVQADGTVRHELAPGIESPEKGWSHGLPDGPPGDQPLAVLVEDLARERWSAVRIAYSNAYSNAYSK